MDLVSVLERIRQSEIDVSMISRCDFGWQLEIEGGQVARALVNSAADAAKWFHAQVLIHFPESSYAKFERGNFREAVTVKLAGRSLSAL
jgi:hypothetical protein